MARRSVTTRGRAGIGERPVVAQPRRKPRYRVELERVEPVALVVLWPETA